MSLTNDQMKWLAAGFFLGIGMMLLLFVVGDLFGQETDAERVSAGGELRTLVLLGTTYLAGFLSERSYNGIKTIVPWWDNQPAIYHQVAAPVLGFAFGFAAAGLTAAQLLDVDGPAAPLVGGVVNALVMAGIFRKDKTQAPRDATDVVELSRENLSPL